LLRAKKVEKPATDCGIDRQHGFSSKASRRQDVRAEARALGMTPLFKGRKQKTYDARQMTIKDSTAAFAAFADRIGGTWYRVERQGLSAFQ
jgi:hypothetical protein